VFGIIEKIVLWLYAYFQRKREVETDLEGLSQGLLMTTVSNHLDRPLDALYGFFTKHPKLLEHPENRLFVTPWLMDPYRQASGSVPGLWTKERWNQVRSDVATLRSA